MDKALWDDTSDCDKPLRRPNINSTVDNTVKQTNEESNFTGNSQHATHSSNHRKDTLNNSSQFNDIVQKSKLSADAKEWYPSSFTKTTPQLAQPAQNRLQRIKHENVTSDDTVVETSQNTFVFDPMPLDLLIKSLIYDPGQFDNLIENFLAILAPHFENVDVANKTAKIIFENALREPSFRYNAARLCSILDDHYPLFRAQLHILCEKELELDRSQGLTLFLAELFMQLHYQAVYGRCVLGSLKKLVSSDVPEDIKSACQALKVYITAYVIIRLLMFNQLAGYSLESNNKKVLDEIFQSLQARKPVLQQSLINLVDSVVALRSNNWGRNTNPVASNNRYLK